jgi:hypothetical protein
VENGSNPEKPKLRSALFVLLPLLFVLEPRRPIQPLGDGAVALCAPRFSASFKTARRYLFCFALRKKPYVADAKPSFRDIIATLVAVFYLDTLVKKQFPCLSRRYLSAVNIN